MYNAPFGQEDKRGLTDGRFETFSASDVTATTHFIGVSVTEIT